MIYRLLLSTLLQANEKIFANTRQKMYYRAFLLKMQTDAVYRADLLSRYRANLSFYRPDSSVLAR